MSPRTEKQFQDIRSSRKYQIIKAALKIFAEEGYHKASIAQISQEANISKGLIYNYFESKKDLLKEVLYQGIEGIKESFSQIEDELDAPEELEIFIKGGIGIMEDESDFYKFYFAVIMQPEVYAIVKENYPEYVGELLERVAKYFKDKGDPHPVEKATVLAALMDGLGMYYLMAPEMYDLKVYEKIIIDLFK